MKIYTWLWFILGFSFGGIAGVTITPLLVEQQIQQVPSPMGITYHYNADVNDDGVTNERDLDIVKKNIDKKSNNWSDGDINQDGVVDSLDLSLVQADYGKKSPIMRLL